MGSSRKQRKPLQSHREERHQSLREEQLTLGCHADRHVRRKAPPPQHSEDAFEDWFCDETQVDWLSVEMELAQWPRKVRAAQASAFAASLESALVAALAVDAERRDAADALVRAEVDDISALVDMAVVGNACPKALFEELQTRLQTVDALRASAVRPTAEAGLLHARNVHDAISGMFGRVRAAASAAAVRWQVDLEGSTPSSIKVRNEVSGTAYALAADEAPRRV